MKGQRSYFVCSAGEPGKDYDDENLKRIIDNKAFVLNEDAKQKGVYNNIKPNDILLLKYKDHFIAYGEAIEIKKTDDPGWNLWAPVNKWYFKNEIVPGEGVSKYGIGFHTIGGGGRGTVKEIDLDFAIAKLKEINLNSDLLTTVLVEINDKIMEEEMKNKIQLLEQNYQIILTGAPGTGKTYLAKEIAKEIVKTDNESNSTESYFNEHISFVQFHPSYDYTDFMEGLRPHKEDGKEMGFKLKNGIFKEFCIKANKEENKKAKYVFIIDEINRGEISKIFGELFFALDPGYRGKKGLIRTQYYNINEKEDFVDFETKSFCVPDNVYIIGTMNDIDRSVESFDFAMRRRFAWIEITPEDSVSMWENQIDSYKNKALAKMNSLNKIIKMNENLGNGFQIGPAYFLKLKNYDGDFDKLWKFHLEILLKEYLRGLPNIEDQLQKLKTAYDAIA